jgi:transposase
MDNKRMVYNFLLINLKEVGLEVDPNPDGGTVCMVIQESARSEIGKRGRKIEKIV